MKSFTVVFNGQSVIEYDRNVRLPGQQRSFLDKMDSDMDVGIELEGEKIIKPDQTQKAKYIAMHLVEAIVQDDESMIAALSAYLANRLSNLTQLRANQDNELFEIDLVFDDELQNQVAVQFNPSLTNKKTH